MFKLMVKKKFAILRSKILLVWTHDIINSQDEPMENIHTKNTLIHHCDEFLTVL